MSNQTLMKWKNLEEAVVMIIVEIIMKMRMMDEDSEVGDGCDNGACHAIRKSLWILSTINY